MKRISCLAALLLALLLIPGGCQSAGSSRQDSQSGSGAGQILPLEGIDAENYPTVNGSTANHPLICRIYEEICGVSEEKAETMVNLDLGSTGSIWVNMLNGYGPDLLIVYEPPEEVKAEYASKLEQFEIDPLGRDGLVFLANAKNPDRKSVV